jgi:hypothetical protein
MVDDNEYKRRQAPPEVRITTRAFGKDRRLPITGGYVAPGTFEVGKNLLPSAGRLSPRIAFCRSYSILVH